MFDVFYIGKKPNLFVHEKQVDSIEQARNLSRTRFFWIVSYLFDYTGFDFLWEPVPWEEDQRHAWPSQWHKDSGTYLIPKDGYTETHYRTEHKVISLADMDLWQVPVELEGFDYSWHPDFSDPPFNYQFGTQWQKTGGPYYSVSGAVDTKYLSQSTSKIKAVAQHVYIIDHLNKETSDVVSVVEQQLPVVKKVRYFDNYMDILKRIANNVPENIEYIWVCSSICDYSNFDFTWHPEVWQNNMLHVFPSNEQKFGDTFFVNVKDFKNRINEFELLEWYDLNFVSSISVPRLPMPVIKHSDDTHVASVKSSTFAGPVALFTVNEISFAVPTIPLWREKTKTIIPLSAGASTTVVPKNAIPYIKTQLYDYPYIDKTQRKRGKDKQLDIIFISNGEPNADYNFNWLQTVTGATMNSNLNRIARIDRVNGRVAAYHAAARESTTPWFFAVFAKLKVEKSFDWSWQPDRMQQAKHYIFHARNPVNGLEYGHQAMIAYNKELTLNNVGQGLDFTLDSEHEVVPIVSGTADYNTSPWVSWRTAFREVLKLRTSLPDVESEYRINRWCTNGVGPNCQWSSIGAQDALEYYDQVQGKFDELKKSYEWNWLASYAFIKHNLVPD